MIRRQLVQVAVEWRLCDGAWWNEHAAEVARVPIAPLVVVGTAYDGDGAMIAGVRAGCGHAAEADALIDRELSPALDALLDQLVGPLYWKRVA